MGTHKGSSAKKASSPTAMKHKPTSHAKRASPVSRGTTPPQNRSAVQKGWEESRLANACPDEPKQLVESVIGSSRLEARKLAHDG